MLAGCAASYESKPNAIQRADIISKNVKSITIEHSSWGKKIAFRLADEHCTELDKIAIYQGAPSQFGADVISTWVCE